jgi:diguanylate cyclase (GGDEF)-like protein
MCTQLLLRALKFMDAASVLRPRHGGPTSRGLEITSLLRAAVLEGDEARIARLLSELLRVKGLTKGQRVALQLKALQNLLHALRSSALNDETTGLYNRRGFVQTGTRLLDVATREELPAHLIYFSLGQLELLNETVGRSAGDVLVRQMGNFLRDLFPSYGVYEVLGRLSRNEFAALSTSSEHSTRSAILLRVHRPQRSCDLPALPLSIGVAHFDPHRPVSVDELLQSAQAALHAPERSTEQAAERVVRIASSELAPQPGVTLC